MSITFIENETKTKLVLSLVECQWSNIPMWNAIAQFQLDGTVKVHLGNKSRRWRAYMPISEKKITQKQQQQQTQRIIAIIK